MWGHQVCSSLSGKTSTRRSDPNCRCSRNYCSEAWGPLQFQEKHSRSEKAILGALGAFQGILGAALGIQKVTLGMRNSILGMASHDLSNTKARILRATPGAIPGIDGNPHERFSFAPLFSERFLRIGTVPARKNYRRTPYYVIIFVIFTRIPPEDFHSNVTATSLSPSLQENMLRTLLCKVIVCNQNFQRDLGAIGPYEFQGKLAWTNPLVPCCLQIKSVWTNGPESLSKVFPRLALVHGWVFPAVQEPNWNRKPERSAPLSQEPEAETEPQKPLYNNRNWNPNCASLLHLPAVKDRESRLSLDELCKLTTGAARTVPRPNSNRTKPHCG